MYVCMRVCALKSCNFWPASVITREHTHTHTQYISALLSPHTQSQHPITTRHQPSPTIPQIKREFEENVWRDISQRSNILTRHRQLGVAFSLTKTPPLPKKMK